MGDFTPGIMGGPIIPGITDDEVKTLDTVIRVTTSDCAPPAKPLAVPEEPIKELFSWVCTFLRRFDVPVWLARMIAGIAIAPVVALNYVAAWFLSVFAQLTSLFASEGLALIDVFRKALDPTVANVAVEVLNELMGTSYGQQHLPAGGSVGEHIARALEVGSLYIDTITREISPGTDLERVDGQAGAARFTGLIVNFGVATALLGLFGELGTLGFIKNFRLIGEQVSSGLGLSKQMRIAIKPLLKTLVATPFQWQLNKEFHPQRFSVAEVVNPFLATTMDHDLIVKDLELQGWSSDRAEALIKLHQKRLSVEEVETLRRWTFWSEARARKYVKDLGWPEDMVDTLLSLPELKRVDARLLHMIDVMETRVNDGHMSLEDFKAVLQTVPMTQHERDVILDTVLVQAKTPHKSLTIAEGQSAFEQGIFTLDDLDALFIRLGLTADDELTLRTLTLLKFAQFEEAKKVAAFAYEKKVATAKAKKQPIPPPPAILV